MKTGIRNTESVAGANSEGVQLKLAAIAKLERARALIDASREDMSLLQGKGYCEKYEAAGELSEQLEQLTSKYIRLAPPTGVFKW